MERGIIKTLLCFIAPGLLMLPQFLYAAGYKMEFQSTSILADAGEAAVVEDAGTNWFNSAGLVDLPHQYVFSVIDVYAPVRFTGQASAPSQVPLAFGGLAFSASGNASAHTNSIIPAIHYTYPFRDRFAIGISVVPAWGFKEDYNRTSILRYDLTSVYTKTIDLAPSLAMKINNQWSVGLGPDFNYFSVQSSAMVRTQGAFAPFIGTTGDSIQRFTANQWHTGWHAGVLYHMNDKARVGLNYRSKIIMSLDGFSDFALNNGPGYESNNFNLRIPLPATTTLSGYYDVTPRWALLGTIAYDEWDMLQAYNAKNVIEPPAVPGAPPSLIAVVLPQNMKNTFDYSVGTHYKVNDKWMLRSSIKYEPTPTNNQDRDINFPDGDKLGIQIGSRYQINQRVGLDFIYGHVFVKQVPINITNPVTFASTNGHTRTRIDLLGVQVVVNI